MEPIEIGDILLLSDLADERVMLMITEQQDYSFWTVDGVTAAIAWLSAWLIEHQGDVA